MAHWLDEAAAGLSEGRYNRRQILRRGGAVAGGALLASFARPVTAKAAGVPCPDFDSPCFSPDICCGDTCLKPSSRLGCCHGSTYDPSIEKCCPHGKQACFNDETCCADTCLKPSSRLDCCHDSTYDPSIEKCCPHGKQACFKDETCCGQDECCRKGHHCVTCGSGKKLCCPAGEYCCNGVCCKPADCHKGVCSKSCKTDTDCGHNGYCCADGGGANAHCCPGPGSCCSGAAGTGLAVCCPFSKANPSSCCIYGSGTAVACIYDNQVCCYVNGQLIGCPPGQRCLAKPPAIQYCGP